ncbi:MAG TPA: SgcJ/EcaC family oxidoreductase [Vicinamibacterales bacterium]|nr:SgcJ/EcaC family oxidoreductase [Vicinamibacterales bacterium]
MTSLPVRSLATLALVAALAACAPAPPPDTTDTTAEDTAAINALRDGWSAAYNAADADALANSYTEDTVRMSANEPSQVGRVAVRDGFLAEFGAGQGTATIRSDEMRLMGDWAFDRGTFSVSIVPAAGGDPVMAEGRYLVLLHKQADGSWKIARGMDNSATPLPMAAGGN